MHYAKRALRSVGVTRREVAAWRMRGERAVGVLRGKRDTQQGRILAYHSVGTPSWGVNDVSPKRFRRQLELALENGYRFVPASHIARTGGESGDLAITFDDGVASVVENAAPILDSLDIPWTFFVTTDYIEQRSIWPAGTFANWKDLERAQRLGATLGSHAVSHRNFGTLSKGETADELGLSAEHIESALGTHPDEFAIPFGRSRDWTKDAQELAVHTGYEFVYAYSENKRFPGTVGRTAVTRFDSDRIFLAALKGAFDNWEEWI